MHNNHALIIMHNEDNYVFSFVSLRHARRLLLTQAMKVRKFSMDHIVPLDFNVVSSAFKQIKQSNPILTHTDQSRFIFNLTNIRIKRFDSSTWVIATNKHMVILCGSLVSGYCLTKNLESPWCMFISNQDILFTQYI